MSETRYFVIYTDKDGDVSLEIMRKDTLEHRLNENYWGANVYLKSLPDQEHDLQGLPGLIIIEGSLIVPEIVETVTKWQIKLNERI